MRTWEQIIKFDSGLSIGVHCVTLKLSGHERVALVEITNKGKVWLLAKPNEGDMYSSWSLLDGDMQTKGKGAIIVWGVHNPEVMAQFDNPIKTIEKA